MQFLLYAFFCKFCHILFLLLLIRQYYPGYSLVSSPVLNLSSPVPFQFFYHLISSNNTASDLYGSCFADSVLIPTVICLLAIDQM